MCSRADLLLLHQRMFIGSNISSAEETLYIQYIYKIHWIGRNSPWWRQRRAWPKSKNRFKCAFCESRCRLISLLVQNSPTSDIRVQLAVCMTEEDISSDILHVWQWIIMSLCNGPNVIIIITDNPGFFFFNSTFSSQLGFVLDWISWHANCFSVLV